MTFSPPARGRDQSRVLSNAVKQEHRRHRPARCEACDRFADKLCLDHNHATGEVRGWLCNSCNTALGFVGDDPLTLERLTAYVRRGYEEIDSPTLGDTMTTFMAFVRGQNRAEPMSAERGVDEGVAGGRQGLSDEERAALGDGVIFVYPLEDTRTAERPCKWRAECVVDGVDYAAESRSGAPNELARRLIAAGVDPGKPVEIGYRGVAGHMSYPSLGAAAKWTFEEGPSTPLRARVWKDPSERLAALGGKGILGGISSELESEPVPSAAAHENAVFPDTSPEPAP
jgi:hypothetical protein